MKSKSPRPSLAQIAAREKNFAIFRLEGILQSLTNIASAHPSVNHECLSATLFVDSALTKLRTK